MRSGWFESLFGRCVVSLMLCEGVVVVRYLCIVSCVVCSIVGSVSSMGSRSVVVMRLRI